MEKLFTVIKNTEEFKKYVDIVQKYSETPLINRYKMIKTSETDISLAILETSSVEINEDSVSISAINSIGKLGGAEIVGDAIYSASIRKNDNDLILNGSINAKFTSYNDSMFDDHGSYREIDELLLDEKFEKRFENMADLYPSKTK